MKRTTPTARAGATLGLELVSAGIWSLISPQTLADNAQWLVILGLVLIVLAWFSDEFVEFYRWRRGKPTIHIENRTSKMPTKVSASGQLTTFSVIAFGEPDTVQLSRGSRMFLEEESTIDYGPEGPPSAERVAITNYGPHHLSNVALTLTVRMDEIEKTDGGWKSGATVVEKDIEIWIDRVVSDPDHPSVFYVKNETPHCVAIGLKAVNAKPVGGTLRPAAVDYNWFGGSFVLSPAERFSK